MAPLKTYYEHCYNLTAEQVEAMVVKNAREAREQYERQIETNRASYAGQREERVKVESKPRPRGRKKKRRKRARKRIGAPAEVHAAPH